MKNTSVGDIGEDLLLFGAVGIGLYFLLKKILPNIGQGIDDNNAGAASATVAAAASDLANAQASGVKQTLSNSAIAAMASTINNDLQITDFWSGSPDPNLSDAVLQVAQCITSTDWYQLVKAFGVKNFNTGGSLSICSWTASQCTQMGLVAALQAAIGWAVAEGNASDANLQAQNLNATMQVLGVSQTFTT